MHASDALKRYRTLGITTLIITLLVILWGAFVRLSGSGDGCGTNWPLCKGVLFPTSETFETYVEFAHRFTSGISFLMVCVLYSFARKLFAPQSPARIAAGWALLFMILEAGIGAVLVLFGWVDDNLSVGRAAALSLHLVNTFFLVSSLGLSVWYAASTQESAYLSSASSERVIVSAAFILLCVTGVLGVLAALSVTFFPSEGLYHGIKQDLSSEASLLVRLRVFHPFVAMISAGLLWWICSMAEHGKPPESISKVLHYIRVIVITQILVGASALIQKELLIVKLTHLLLADLVVLLFAIIACEVLRGRLRLEMAMFRRAIPER